MVVNVRIHFDDAKINVIRKMLAKDSTDTTNKKIMTYYKKLGQLIADEYNENTENLNKLTGGAFLKPTVTVTKTSMTTKIKAAAAVTAGSPKASLDASNVDKVAAQMTDTILSAIIPPAVIVEFCFNMESDEEKAAVKLFKKESLTKDEARGKKYDEVKTLFYTTELAHFINDTREFLQNNVYWKAYSKRRQIKTKFAPESGIGNIVVTRFR